MDGPSKHTRTRVAFQGEIGAFSEQAALAFVPEEKCIPVPCSSFEGVFGAIESGDSGYGVIPIENSVWGSVHPNYDLLREHDVRIVGELKLRIVHNLLALPGESLDTIVRVRSHPQAIGQCRTFLRTRLADAEVIPSYDTAGAAKNIAHHEERGTAAIASLAAATEYGLDVLESGIESDHGNYTRFLCIEPGAATACSSERPVKTSIVYAMRKNVPGALFKSLAVFALRDLDLVKIESRPLVGSPFEYLFYLDFLGTLSDEVVERALSHLSEIAGYLKVLGSYPVGPTVD